MRAKTVRERIKTKAMVFDLDDTLIKTDAKVKVLKNDKIYRYLTPAEFNFYEKKPDEEFDLSDFNDPRLILNARKYKMWPALQNINMAIKQGKSNSDIYILTARTHSIKSVIHNFFTKNNIDIPIENIITIGDNKGDMDISATKREILKDIKSRYDEITFFDDNPETIKLIAGIKGIHTRLIDSNRIYK